MSRDAGADVERGVFAAGIIYENGKFSIGAIDYFSQTSSTSPMAKPRWNCRSALIGSRGLPSSSWISAASGTNSCRGQFFRPAIRAQSGVAGGKNALFTAAFTHAANGDANMQNPWSGYPGYTSVQVQDFNRAGEDAFLFRAGYDFPWVEGLSAYALAVFGTDPKRAGQFRQDEYDVNLQWAPPKGCPQGFLVSCALRTRPAARRRMSTT